MRVPCMLVGLLLAAASARNPRLAPQNKKLFVLCHDVDSLVCPSWLINQKDLQNNAYFVSNQYKSCGITDLQPIPENKYVYKISSMKPGDAYRLVTCKIVFIVNDLKPSTTRKVPFFKRKPRSLRGRFRGQTQSQYLNIDQNKGNGDEGKAEAHSAADTSRAIVSGRSGMGQAQSQTMYDPNCDDCYNENIPQSLRDRDHLSSWTGSSNGHRPQPPLNFGRTDANQRGQTPGAGIGDIQPGFIPGSRYNQHSPKTPMLSTNGNHENKQPNQAGNGGYTPGSAPGSGPYLNGDGTRQPDLPGSTASNGLTTPHANGYRPGQQGTSIIPGRHEVGQPGTRGWTDGGTSPGYTPQPGSTLPSSQTPLPGGYTPQPGGAIPGSYTQQPGRNQPGGDTIHSGGNQPGGYHQRGELPGGYTQQPGGSFPGSYTQQPGQALPDSHNTQSGGTFPGGYTQQPGGITSGGHTPLPGGLFPGGYTPPTEVTKPNDYTTQQGGTIPGYTPQPGDILPGDYTQRPGESPGSTGTGDIHGQPGAPGHISQESNGHYPIGKSTIQTGAPGYYDNGLTPTDNNRYNQPGRTKVPNRSDGNLQPGSQTWTPNYNGNIGGTFPNDGDIRRPYDTSLQIGGPTNIGKPGMITTDANGNTYVCCPVDPNQFNLYGHNLQTGGRGHLGPMGPGNSVSQSNQKYGPGELRHPGPTGSDGQNYQPSHTPGWQINGIGPIGPDGTYHPAVSGNQNQQRPYYPDHQGQQGSHGPVGSNQFGSDGTYSPVAQGTYPQGGRGIYESGGQEPGAQGNYGPVRQATRPGEQNVYGPGGPGTYGSGGQGVNLPGGQSTYGPGGQRFYIPGGQGIYGPGQGVNLPGRQTVYGPGGQDGEGTRNNGYGTHGSGGQSTYSPGGQDTYSPGRHSTYGPGGQGNLGPGGYYDSFGPGGQGAYGTGGPGPLGTGGQGPLGIGGQGPLGTGGQGPLGTGGQGPLGTGGQGPLGTGGQGPLGTGGQGPLGTGGQSPLGTGGQSPLGTGGQSPLGTGGQGPLGTGGQSPLGTGGQGPLGTGGQSPLGTGGQGPLGIGGQGHLGTGGQIPLGTGGQGYVPGGHGSFRPGAQDTYRPEGQGQFKPDGQIDNGQRPQSTYGTGGITGEQGGQTGYRPGEQGSYIPGQGAIGTGGESPLGGQGSYVPGRQSAYEPGGTGAYAPGGQGIYSPDGRGTYGQGGQPNIDHRVNGGQGPGGINNYGTGGPGAYGPGTYGSGGNGPYGESGQGNYGPGHGYRPGLDNRKIGTDETNVQLSQTGGQGGVPQNVLDPNVIVSEDDSEALATVNQGGNGTIASASSKGGNEKGRAQTQVQGTYSGSGSFSAQAQITDDSKGAESQVTGSKEGASGSAQGRGRNNKSQAQVELGSETGSLQTQAQSEGVMHSSNSQVQGSVKGGMADAQARGPGSTSSQAQIGFTPYKEGDKSHEQFKSPFYGGGTASAQSSGRTGQSQSQLQGTFKYGIQYNGAAQAGASIDKDTKFPNRLPFNKIDVFDEANKNIDVNSPTIDTSTSIIDTTTNLATIDLDTKSDGHSHSDHHTGRTQSPINSRRSFQYNHESDNEYTTSKFDNASDDYDVDAPFEAEGVDAEYTNYDDFNHDLTHQPIQSAHKKGLDIKQSNRGGTQHIVLGSLKGHNAEITQHSSEQRPDESRIYQPGERVPGTGGYTIPLGFTGSVKSVASKSKTYAIGSRDSPSQAQTVTLTPGTGKVKYVYSKPSAVNPKDLKSLLLPKKDEDNRRYMSVSKSVSGALDGDNNIKKQYSHTYYTKSSSCGYFTFTCTIVSGSDGRKKVCKPKIPTNPDGTPMNC